MSFWSFIEFLGCVLWGCVLFGRETLYVYDYDYDYHDDYDDMKLRDDELTYLGTHQKHDFA